VRDELNGMELKVGANDELPELAGVPVTDGDISFAPATIACNVEARAARVLRLLARISRHARSPYGRTVDSLFKAEEPR
jgi:hypothetical protein